METNNAGTCRHIPASRPRSSRLKKATGRTVLRRTSASAAGGGGESSLVELPPSVLQPAMENTTSARLPEIPIDTDKTIPGDLAVALDAENGSNRPNSTDEALCDDRVPDL